MAHISEVTIEELGMSLRIDSQFYQPQFLIDTSKGKWIKIKECIKCCEYGLSLAMNDDRKGVPMLKMDDISNCFLHLDEARYANVSKKNQVKYQCHENDLFFNRVNSEEFVGRTGIYKYEDRNAVFASYLIRVQTDSSIILPQYLNIFINSKYGQKQIDRYKRRAVNQANINAQELQEFQVYIPKANDQRRIAGFVDQAWMEIVRSKSLYQQAEQLLLKELGLDDFEPEWVAGYETDRDNVLDLARMDAEYFQPRFEIVKNKIEEYSNGWKYLPKLIEISKQKIDPTDNKEYTYIELADINAGLGIVESTNAILGKELPTRARMKVNKGDVLLSSVAGSIDKVGLVNSDQKDLIASTGFHIFRSKIFSPEVNLIICKCLALQLLFLREATGTILSAIPTNALERIPIPNLRKEIQSKITDLVKKSHNSLYESRKLLEKAKKEVEEMIENS